MIYIHALGHFRPDNIIDNKFLENLDIGTTDEWILERVGIKSRRTVLDLDYIKETKNSNPVMAKEASLYSNAQTGAYAAKRAIDNSSISINDIGMVIAGGCSPQYSCPTEAATIASELNIEVPSIDINSACSSVGAQINFLNMMKPDMLPEYILIINPENSTRSINYSDRASAILWGDCTSAMIVSTKHKSNAVVRNTFLQSSPKMHDKVVFDTNSFFRQEGRTVQTFAIKKSLSVIKKLKSSMSLENASNIKFIGHQANLMMLNSVARMAEIKSENHFFNVDEFGNCGAAGSVSVLSENIRKLVKGDNLILAVVGGGLTWAGFQIEII